MKKEINRTLGNSLRCILPSFWWKRLLGKMADRIESAESAASNASRIAMLAGMEAADKQEKLYSGSNIKTINGESLLGSGNLEISGGDANQIIFYATEGDAVLTDAQIAHNVESMQKQRTAFLNNTPVAFFISVKGSDGVQLFEPVAFYSPSNNTAIPVLFYIMGGGFFQYGVTCNWDGTATLQDVNWIDSELSETRESPVQNKVVTAALNEKASIAYVDEKVANAGGGNITVDSEFSETSENPVQNKVITEALNDLVSLNEQTNNSLFELSKDINVKINAKADISYVDEKVANVGSGSNITVDSELSETSENPVQNKVIYEEFQNFGKDVEFVLDGLDGKISSKADSTRVDLISERLDDIQSEMGDLVTESELEEKGYVTTSQLSSKQDEIKDLETIRAGAAKGATALQSVPSEYVTETELNNKGYITEIPDGYITDGELEGKGYVTEGYVLEITERLQSDMDDDKRELTEYIDNKVSGFVTYDDTELREGIDNIQKGIIANEETISASLNEMNSRINEVSSKVTGETATKDELQQAVDTINEVINDNEEVTASALNLANYRIEALEKNVSGASVTKSEFENAISEVYNAIIENEEVHAHAINDINTRLQAKIVAIDLGIIIDD